MRSNAPSLQEPSCDLRVGALWKATQEVAICRGTCSEASGPFHFVITENVFVPMFCEPLHTRKFLASWVFSTAQHCGAVATAGDA